MQTLAFCFFNIWRGPSFPFEVWTKTDISMHADKRISPRMRDETNSSKSETKLERIYMSMSWNKFAWIFWGTVVYMFNILARHDTSSSLPGSSAGCACSEVFLWSAGNIFDNGGINKGRIQPSISCNILVSISQQWWLRCLGYIPHIYALQSQV